MMTLFKENLIKNIALIAYGVLFGILIEQVLENTKREDNVNLGFYIYKKALDVELAKDGVIVNPKFIQSVDSLATIYKKTVF